MSSNATTGGLPNRRPAATARVYGSDQSPNVSGVVHFYAAPGGGSIVTTNISGLPPITLPTGANGMQIGPFGFHVHEGTSCGSATAASPFAAAGGHYNPTNQPHPLHAGDLPVLFPNNGMNVSKFYTDRFSPQDVIGRTVVIHQMPDDFRTQPAGDSGMRIGCGEIEQG